MENVKTNETKIFVYLYMWLFDGSENMCIKVLSDIPEAHEKFMDMLKADERVSKASRVYLHEYDINKIEFYENIVTKEDC